MRACPHLPPAEGVCSASWMRRFGNARGGAFYLGALRCAQGLWQAEKPAQAILQLNRAMSADLAESAEVLAEWPPPYRALVWMLRNRPEGPFVGNPVRHFQHLASRVSGARKEVRSWRAWACFHLSEGVLDDAGRYPRDEEQIRAENLEIPGWTEVLERLGALGWPGEPEELRVARAD